MNHMIDKNNSYFCLLKKLNKVTAKDATVNQMGIERCVFEPCTQPVLYVYLWTLSIYAAAILDFEREKFEEFLTCSPNLTLKCHL